MLRGLHYHFKQVDYWYVPARHASVSGWPTCAAARPPSAPARCIEIGDDNQIGVFIPCGVAHGFYALTDVTLTYLVDNYYDGADELGVAWNDPDVGGGLGCRATPILSGLADQQPIRVAGTTSQDRSTMPMWNG